MRPLFSFNFNVSFFFFLFRRHFRRHRVSGHQVVTGTTNSFQTIADVFAARGGRCTTGNQDVPWPLLGISPSLSLFEAEKMGKGKKNATF